MFTSSEVLATVGDGCDDRAGASLLCRLLSALLLQQTQTTLRRIHSVTLARCTDRRDTHHQRSTKRINQHSSPLSVIKGAAFIVMKWVGKTSRSFYMYASHSPEVITGVDCTIK